MRLNVRMKLWKVTVFFLVSFTQTLEGITSRVGRNEHLIFWDLEDCSLDDVVQRLSSIQCEFQLGDIFVTSDMEGSYRAWCFSRRKWLDYIHILIHSFPLLDYGFFVWTIRRNASTLRLTNKKGRQPQRVVALLKGFEETVIPERLVHVLYDTGVEKEGRTIRLG